MTYASWDGSLLDLENFYKQHLGRADHKGLQDRTRAEAPTRTRRIGMYSTNSPYTLFASPAWPPTAKLLTQRKKTSEFSSVVFIRIEQSHSAPLGGAIITEINLPSITDSYALVQDSWNIPPPKKIENILVYITLKISFSWK